MTVADPDRQGPWRTPAPAGWKRERARALLQCDEGPEGEGWPDATIAVALDVSARRVGRWRCQAVEAGPEAVRERRARAPRPCQRDGAGEAQLLQWAQSAPPAGRARGTLRLLAQELEARAVVADISYETVRRTLKNELTIFIRMQRGYPSVRESAFVAPREAVRDLYGQPYAARYPVICRDEQPKQRLSETRTPRPAQPGQPATYDYAYVRQGSCTVWLFVEPLGPWRAQCRP